MEPEQFTQMDGLLSQFGFFGTPAMTPSIDATNPKKENGMLTYWLVS